MRSLMLLAACVAGLSCVQPAMASPAPATPDARAVAAEASNAMQLSKLLNPTDQVVDLAVRGFDVGFDTELKKRPEDAALFNENPGLVDAIKQAVRPIIRKHTLASLPSLQSRCADFYARRFEAGEIDRLVSFYSSATGSKLIAGMYAGADLDKLTEALGESGQEPLTRDSLEKFTNSTAARILPAFNAEDWKALFEFAATPVFAKLRTVLPEFTQMMADVSNEPTPEMDAELEKAVDAVIADYMKRASAKHTT